VLKQGKSILIISEDVNNEPLSDLIINKLRAGLKICAIKAPAFGDNRRNTLEDVAMLTGAQVVSEDAGL